MHVCVCYSHNSTAAHDLVRHPSNLMICVFLSHDIGDFINEPTDGIHLPGTTYKTQKQLYKSLYASKDKGKR